MKKSKKIVAIVFISLFTFMILQVYAATPVQPGSQYDPLITKSYLDEQLEKIYQSINNNKTSTSGTTTNNNTSNNTNTSTNQTQSTVSDLEFEKLKTENRELLMLVIENSKKINNLEKQNQELIEKMHRVEEGYIVLELSKGQKLYTGAGSEIVLRYGELQAIAGQYGGLSDVTSAKDISTGGKIDLNHLIISSRNDGRGVLIASDIAYILVRGAYTIG